MYAILTVVLLVQAPPDEKDDPRAKDIVFLREKVIAAEWLRPNAMDSPLRKLQKEQCSEMASSLIKRFERIIDGLSSQVLLYDLVDIMDNYSTLFEYAAKLAEKPEDKVKCYEMRVEKLKEIHQVSNTRVQDGTDPPQREAIAKALLIDAEIELLKLKESLKSGK
jgi:hypothetical protein